MLGAALQKAGHAFIDTHKDEYERRLVAAHEPLGLLEPPAIVLSEAEIEAAKKEANDAYDRIVAYVETRKAQKAIEFQSDDDCDYYPHEVKLLVPSRVIGIQDVPFKAVRHILARLEAQHCLIGRLKGERITMEEIEDDGWILKWGVRSIGGEKTSFIYVTQ